MNPLLNVTLQSVRMGLHSKSHPYKWQGGQAARCACCVRSTPAGSTGWVEIHVEGEAASYRSGQSLLAIGHVTAQMAEVIKACDNLESALIPPAHRTCAEAATAAFAVGKRLQGQELSSQLHLMPNLCSTPTQAAAQPGPAHAPCPHHLPDHHPSQSQLQGLLHLPGLSILTRPATNLVTSPAEEQHQHLVSPSCPLQTVVMTDAVVTAVAAIPMVIMSEAHRHLDWRLVIPLTLGKAATSPLGAAALKVLNRQVVELIMACTLLLLLCLSCDAVSTRLKQLSRSQSVGGKAAGGLLAAASSKVASNRVWVRKERMRTGDRVAYGNDSGDYDTPECPHGEGLSTVTFTLTSGEPYWLGMLLKNSLISSQSAERHGQPGPKRRQAADAEVQIDAVQPHPSPPQPTPASPHPTHAQP
ncbi:hypothetical protein QJQ45_017639 [Haematococcus lacustris]|nr:hypothetical protein QJQ45_017639 [Haematococcus lacustris]